MPGGANKKPLRQARSRKTEEADTTPTESSQPPEQDTSEDEECLCTICVEPINFFALGSACHHKSVCSLCAIRQRKLYGKKECAFCKAEHEKMIITPHHDKDFEDYDLSTALQLEGEDNHLYFLDAATLAVHQKLFMVVCPECKNHFPSIDKLKIHVKKKHELTYCDVCLEHVKDYLQEFPLYTQEQLRQHIKGNPARPDVTGHPNCQICRSAFYDDQELWLHMYNNHLHCGVCARINRDAEYQFFKNYHQLARHYEKAHHPCRDPICVGAKHIVFASDIELQEHMILNHTEGLSKSQQKQARTLNLEFEFAQPARPSQRQQRQRNQPNRHQNQNQNQSQHRGQNERNSKREDPVDVPVASTNGNATEGNKKKPQKKQQKKDGKREPAEPSPLSPKELSSSSFVMPPLPMSHDELKERNRVLVREMKSILNGNDFSHLRALIAEYVNEHTLRAPAFHSQAVQLLGTEHAKSILAELMALIPDANKRMELKNAHSTWISSQDKNASPPSPKKKANKKEEKPAAPQPKQEKEEDLDDDLLGAPSLEARSQQDLEQDFPSLSGAPVVPNVLSVGVYNSRSQKKPTVEDFPALGGSKAPSHSSASTTWGSKPNANANKSNPKNKKKQQRKKQVLNIFD